MTQREVVVVREPNRQVVVRDQSQTQIVRVIEESGRGGRVVTFPTGSEPSLDGVPDGTLWVEYQP